jgi:hypothetical protein
MKFANIREMHQWSAVGKTVQPKVDQAKKGLYIVAKIVDDQAWAKIKEGVYNGFSIGGRVLKKINNVIEELMLNEISLVDRPANPLATFSLVKFDKNGKLIQKMPVAIGDQFEQPDIQHQGVYHADQLMAITAQLVSIQNILKYSGKENKYIERSINSLKKAIQIELSADKVALCDPNWSKEYFDLAKKVL